MKRLFLFKLSNWVFITGLILIVIFAFVINTNTAKAKDHTFDEIEDMVELIQEKEFQLETWGVTFKKRRQIQEIDSFIEEIKATYPSASLEITEDEEIIKYHFKRQKKKNVNESILLVIQKSARRNVDIIYEISGSEWTKEGQSTYSLFADRATKVLFNGEFTKFSCITSYKSAIIDIVCLLEELSDLWKINRLDYLNEDDFVVLSGNTPIWDDAVSLTDEKMNVQLAAREGMGGKTTLTIGTPILTSEY